MNIIESNLTFRSLSYGNCPIMIVLHHAESSSCTIKDIHNWHLSRGWSGCGYHFFVGKDGKIYRGRPENAIGAHCPGANSNSLGVCAEGMYMKETMPSAQKQAILEICKYAFSKYGMNIIKGHMELYETDCPGNNYPLNEIKGLATGGGLVIATSSQKVYSNENKNWLQVGDTGYAVLEVQQSLIRLGFGCGQSGADGNYGKNTKNGVYNFQQALKIQDDGVAGTQTIKALRDIVGKPICSKSKSNNENAVRYIQYRLGISVDGVFGHETTAAVVSWQRKNDLSADGIVGSATWEKLIG